MILFFRRTFRDIRANLFLNAVTVLSVAFSVLIFSAFLLFFTNAEAMIRLWLKDMRIMVYLSPDITPAKISDTGRRLKGIGHVRTVHFVSRDDAMKRFRRQLNRQSSLVDNLKENPLPDAFEVGLEMTPRMWEHIAPVALEIEKIGTVAEVEYGEQWIDRCVRSLSLFRLAGYGMGAVFGLAAVFFVANTVRLVLYSRRDEIEIMRLVGASEGFIRDPIYVQSLMLGMVGGLIGLGALYGIFRFVSSRIDLSGPASFFQIRFLLPDAMTGILVSSMVVGWVGCVISLRQFLKK
ncbi:ABC transporter permease [Desulfonema ishimotonii]|uniref:Cell division protein FtsX n=1 Tax=Desulfonema ishimotonii TaxID=45657 RepID=A0A401G1W6_9BACT|nr:permease-like cell division protein FtsX [Desulfonema ishimotonii]GBC63197.1 ABC transporter permease [Desulfonema ishimotonii]